MRDALDTKTHLPDADGPRLHLVPALKTEWDALRRMGKIRYDGSLLQTRVLDPGDGRLPFFLVFNEGRQKYIEQVATRGTALECPFCAEGYGLTMTKLVSLRVLPNTFPCLPYQLILCPDRHTGLVEPQYVTDAIRFAKNTGFKVYCNAPGSGGSYTHLVFQASEKHEAAPQPDFFSTVKGAQLTAKAGASAELIEHTVFGLRLRGANSTSLSAIVVRLAQDCHRRLNLLFTGDQVIIIPRSAVEIPTGFGRWKFGVLEAIGMFICQDQASFEELDYERLVKAMSEISLQDPIQRTRLIKETIQLVESSEACDLQPQED